MNIVAFDFLGHGESPHPHQSELYTANEVSDMKFVFELHGTKVGGEFLTPVPFNLVRKCHVLQ